MTGGVKRRKPNPGRQFFFTIRSGDSTMGISILLYTAW